MIARRHRVALAVTALLAAGAAGRAAVLLEQPRHPAAGHPAPAATRPAAPAAGAFTLLASGGILPDGPVLERAAFDADGSGHDFRPMLSGVAATVARAGLALCHLDTAQSADGTGGSPYTVPPELVPSLAATGYDGCSTASEHTLDDGADGVHRTLDALDRAGLRHAGSARAESESRGALLNAGRARVAHLAYSDGSDRPVPAGQPWALRLIDADRVLADARAARQAGADVVVVSLDWGDAWQDTPGPRQLDLARRLTAARTGDRPAIDLIVGTRSHVPQPYEKVNGTWVIYGTGDQIADPAADAQAPPDPRAHLSTLARFTFAPPARPGGRWQVTRAEFVPEMFDVDAGRVVNVNEAVDQGADLASVRDRISDAVLGRGAAKDGLTMGR
ncbi:CapA family protein [Streptomyces sp. NPDC047017]|uniref:CapA family protein n=1 Tax=Streptomyces sp. NPDC047017 TaxID=3155024 RepID=UPI0033DAD304